MWWGIAKMQLSLQQQIPIQRPELLTSEPVLIPAKDQVAAGISNGKDHRVQVWHCSSEQVIYTLEGYTSPVVKLAISPDGQYLVAASRNGQVSIWNLELRKKIFEITLKGKRIAAVEFSPNAHFFLIKWARFPTGPYGLAVYSVSSAEPILQKPVPYAHCFSADGFSLYLCGQKLSSFSLGIEGGPLSLELRSPEGQQFIQCLDLMNQSITENYPLVYDRDSLILSMQASPDGNVIIYSLDGEANYALRIYDLAKQQDLPCSFSRGVITFSAATSGNQNPQLAAIAAVNFYKDASEIGYGGGIPDLYDALKKKSIQLWDPSDWRLLRQFGTYTGMIISLVFSPCGRWLASGHRNGQIMLWDVRSGQHVAQSQPGKDPVEWLAFTQDSLTLLSYGRNQDADSLTAWICTTLTGKKHRVIHMHSLKD